jgi:hypothetical protein
VKYGLIEAPAVAKSRQVPKAPPPKHPSKGELQDLKMPTPAGKRAAAEQNASAQVVKFPTPGAENSDAPNEDLEGLKDQVRHAL